jgi:sugar phosphate permease
MTPERPWYRWYVLFILTLIYAFSYVDRQIVTILAPYLKKDMGISDAQLGLLYGTSFALFYCVFGIPLARLADGWSRVRTLALGLSFADDRALGLVAQLRPIGRRADRGRSR